MKIITTSRNGKSQRFLLRGDSEGYVTLWNVPDITIEEVKQIQDKNIIKCMYEWENFVDSDAKLMICNRTHWYTIIYFVFHFKWIALTPTICTSLSDAWSLMKPPPVGILDQLNTPTEPSIKLTASIYLPQQSRLVVGRQDGTIIIVPATQTVMLQLLHVQNINYAGLLVIIKMDSIFYIKNKQLCFQRLAIASNFVRASWPSQLPTLSIFGSSTVIFEIWSSVFHLRITWITCRN